MPNARGTDASSHINRDALDLLKPLQIEGEIDVILEITEMFLSMSPEKINSIAKLIESKNFPAAAKEAHGLKSTAFSVGAEKLGKICQEIENIDPKDPNLTIADKIKKEYAMVEAELHAIRTEIKSS